MSYMCNKCGKIVSDKLAHKVKHAFKQWDEEQLLFSKTLRPLALKLHQSAPTKVHQVQRLTYVQNQLSPKTNQTSYLHILTLLVVLSDP